MSEVIVRQATHEDIEALRDYYCPDGKETVHYPQRWQWLFQDNPFIPKDMGLPIWCAFDGDKVVGHTASMMIPLWLEGQEMPASWSIDTFLSPEYRGKGLGKELQRQNQQANDVFMSLRMSTANRAIKKKMGGLESGPIPEYWRIGHLATKNLFSFLRPLFVKKLGRALGNVLYWLAWCIGAFFLLAKYFQWRYRRKSRRKTESCPQTVRQFEEFTGEFGPEADELWHDIRDRYDFAVARNSLYMNWRYRQQPHTGYTVFRMLREGNFEGYLVLRESHDEGKTGAIIDFVTRPDDDDVMNAIIDFSEGWFAERRIRSYAITTSRPEIQQLLESQGYVPFLNKPMMFHGGDLAKPLTESTIHVTHGDHDIDIGRAIPQPHLQYVLRQLRWSPKE